MTKNKCTFIQTKPNKKVAKLLKEQILHNLLNNLEDESIFSCCLPDIISPAYYNFSNFGLQLRDRYCHFVFDYLYCSLLPDILSFNKIRNAILTDGFVYFEFLNIQGRIKININETVNTIKTTYNKKEECVEISLSTLTSIKSYTPTDILNIICNDDLKFFYYFIRHMDMMTHKVPININEIKYFNTKKKFETWKDIFHLIQQIDPKIKLYDTEKEYPSYQDNIHTIQFILNRWYWALSNKHKLIIQNDIYN